MTMNGLPERQHRRFSPSQSERFLGCYGSTNLLDRTPVRPSSPYAIEGTKAHEVLEAALRNGVRRAKEAHEDYSSLCMEDLNTFNNQFYYSIQVALNHVYDILDQYQDAVLFIETYVDPPLPAAPGEAGGYCDVAIYVPSIRVLYVIDYKHGAGVTKAAKGNTQAMQYGAGFLFEDNARANPNDVDTVILTIMQPRAFHEDGMIREYEVTPADLYQYTLRLNDGVLENLKPNAPLRPGTDQCRFCDADTTCPAREASALSAVSDTFKQIQQVTSSSLPIPLSMDIDRLALIRMHAPMLRKWLTSVDNHCEELARTGHAVPGAKLVEAQAKRTWFGTEEEVALKLSALAGVPLEDVKTTRIMNIGSAEKLVVEEFKKRAGRGRKKAAAEAGKTALAFLTLKKSSGNLSLVDEDDTRPAVNRAQSNFAQISGAIAAPKM